MKFKIENSSFDQRFASGCIRTTKGRWQDAQALIAENFFDSRGYHRAGLVMDADSWKRAMRPIWGKEDLGLYLTHEMYEMMAQNGCCWMRWHVAVNPMFNERAWFESDGIADTLARIFDLQVEPWPVERTGVRGHCWSLPKWEMKAIAQGECIRAFDATQVLRERTGLGAFKPPKPITAIRKNLAGYTVPAAVARAEAAPGRNGPIVNLLPRVAPSGAHASSSSAATTGRGSTSSTSGFRPASAPVSRPAARDPPRDDPTTGFMAPLSASATSTSNEAPLPVLPVLPALLVGCKVIFVEPTGSQLEAVVVRVHREILSGITSHYTVRFSNGVDKQVQRGSLVPITSEPQPQPTPQQQPMPPTPTPTPLESMLDGTMMCPITLQVLHNPVDTPCGHTFSRQALESALAVQQRCPTCRQFVQRGQYQQNFAIAKIVSAYRQMVGIPSVLCI